MPTTDRKEFIKRTSPIYREDREKDSRRNSSPAQYLGQLNEGFFDGKIPQADNNNNSMTDYKLTQLLNDMERAQSGTEGAGHRTIFNGFEIATGKNGQEAKNQIYNYIKLETSLEQRRRLDKAFQQSSIAQLDFIITQMSLRNSASKRGSEFDPMVDRSISFAESVTNRDITKKIFVWDTKSPEDDAIKLKIIYRDIVFKITDPISGVENFVSFPGEINVEYTLTKEGFQFDQADFSNVALQEVCFGNAVYQYNLNAALISAQQEEDYNKQKNLGFYKVYDAISRRDKRIKTCVLAQHDKLSKDLKTRNREAAELNGQAVSDLLYNDLLRQCSTKVAQEAGGTVGNTTDINGLALLSEAVENKDKLHDFLKKRGFSPRHIAKMNAAIPQYINAILRDAVLTVLSGDVQLLYSYHASYTTKPKDNNVYLSLEFHHLFFNSMPKHTDKSLPEKKYFDDNAKIRMDFLIKDDGKFEIIKTEVNNPVLEGLVLLKPAYANKLKKHYKVEEEKQYVLMCDADNIFHNQANKYIKATNLLIEVMRTRQDYFNQDHLKLAGNYLDSITDKLVMNHNVTEQEFEDMKKKMIALVWLGLRKDDSDLIKDQNCLYSLFYGANRNNSDLASIINQAIYILLPYTEVDLGEKVSIPPKNKSTHSSLNKDGTPKSILKKETTQNVTVESTKKKVRFDNGFDTVLFTIYPALQKHVEKNENYHFTRGIQVRKNSWFSQEPATNKLNFSVHDYLKKVIDRRRDISEKKTICEAFNLAVSGKLTHHARADLAAKLSGKDVFKVIRMIQALNDFNALEKRGLFASLFNWGYNKNIPLYRAAYESIIRETLGASTNVEDPGRQGLAEQVALLKKTMLAEYVKPITTDSNSQEPQLYHAFPKYNDGISVYSQRYRRSFARTCADIFRRDFSPRGAIPQIEKSLPADVVNELSRSELDQSSLVARVCYNQALPKDANKEWNEIAKSIMTDLDELKLRKKEAQKIQHASAKIESHKKAAKTAKEGNIPELLSDSDEDETSFVERQETHPKETPSVKTSKNPYSLVNNFYTSNHGSFVPTSSDTKSFG